MRVREGIILAAGEGSRLRMYYRIPKPFAPLGRIRLLYFPLISLYRCGVRRFYIVVRKETKRYAEALAKKLANVESFIIVNDNPERENGYSLYLGVKEVQGDMFYVSMGDHIYSPSIPRRLLRYLDESDIVIAADSRPKYIDIEEATRIWAVKGIVRYIGKNLHRFNYVDTGVFIMKKSVLDVLKRLSKTKEKFTVSSFINHCIDLGYRVRIGDVSGMPWLDIDTPREVNKVLQGEAGSIMSTILEGFGEIYEHESSI